MGCDAALRVFATARRLESMEELVGLGIKTYVLDVCDEENVKGVFEWVSGQTGGSLDILVNNALVCEFIAMVPSS